MKTEAKLPDDDPDAPWLRALLREDLARAPYLEDAGFSERVLQALPPPREPWIDGLAVLLTLAALGIGLWPLVAALGERLAGLTATLGAPLLERALAAFAAPTPLSLLPVLAPLLALAASAAVLLDE